MGRDANASRAVFRRANEDLFVLSAELLADDPGALAPFLCECADRSCTRVVRLRLAEYEEARSTAGQFVVLPGHEGPAEDECVVERREGFSLVRSPGAGRSCSCEDAVA